MVPITSFPPAPTPDPTLGYHISLADLLCHLKMCAVLTYNYHKQTMKNYYLINIAIFNENCMIYSM